MPFPDSPGKWSSVLLEVVATKNCCRGMVVPESVSSLASVHNSDTLGKLPYNGGQPTLLTSSTVFCPSLRSVRNRTFGSVLGTARSSKTEDSLSSSSVRAKFMIVLSGSWWEVNRSSSSCDPEAVATFKADSKAVKLALDAPSSPPGIGVLERSDDTVCGPRLA